jgi:hypothetical protein
MARKCPLFTPRQRGVAHLLPPRFPIMWAMTVVSLSCCAVGSCLRSLEL